MISFCLLSVVIYLDSIWNQYNSKSQNNMSTHLTIKNRLNRETRRPRNLSASWGYDLFCVRKQGLSWGRKLTKQQSVKQTSCLDVWTCFLWRRVKCICFWCIWKKKLSKSESEVHHFKPFTFMTSVLKLEIEAAHDRIPVKRILSEWVLLYLSLNQVPSEIK